MTKPLREWRKEAAQLNADAEAQGQPKPIPSASKLRKKDLAKEVIEYNLNSGGQADGYQL